MKICKFVLADGVAGCRTTILCHWQKKSANLQAGRSSPELPACLFRLGKTHKGLVRQIYLEHVGQTSFKLDIPNLAKGDRAAVLKL
jgi:hypothetical protein